MATIKIHGASDDLIIVEGDIEEELHPPLRMEQFYLAVSDGTLLRVRYDDDGCWRFVPIKKGTATYDKVEALGADGDDHPNGEPGYSDVVTLTAPKFAFVLGGEQLAK